MKWKVYFDKGIQYVKGKVVINSMIYLLWFDGRVGMRKWWLVRLGREVGLDYERFVF